MGWAYEGSNSRGSKDVVWCVVYNVASYTQYSMVLWSAKCNFLCFYLELKRKLVSNIVESLFNNIYAINTGDTILKNWNSWIVYICIMSWHLHSDNILVFVCILCIE